MSADDFRNYLKEICEKFTLIPETETIKVVSNLDADGISACAIMVRALERLNRQHSIEIIHQLREPELIELASQKYNNYIFTDLGSGVLAMVEKHLGGKNVLILDHHHPEGEAEKIWHINPHLFGINGSKEISAAGVTFMFCRALDMKNEEMAHIALIGAIGDVQENNGFSGLNNEILNIAVAKGVIKVEKDLNLFGMQTRPIHKLLEYSSDLHIPDVTGSESGSIQFLKSLGIEPMLNSKWKIIGDLTKEEKEKLVAGIIIKRVNEKNPSDIFTNKYILPNEEAGSFHDAKEFSTLLNACGRLDKASVGIGACLGKPEFKKKVLGVYKQYKREIMTAMKWYENSSERVVKGKNYIIINAGNEVLDTIIGTMASILSKSGKLDAGTFILSMARKPKGITKVSIRIAGNPPDIDLRDIIAEVSEKVQGEFGGHQYAAGAVIDTEKEDAFIEAAANIFKNS